MPPRATSVDPVWPWWALWATFGLFSLAIIMPSYLNHDDAWYLYMCRVLLDGGTLYRDVVDTNPPLIIWLSLPAVWIAQLIGASAVVVFKVFVYAMAVASTIVSSRLLSSMADTPPAVRRLVITALVFALLPMARVIEFGQREHFIVMLTMPYLLGAVARAQGRPLEGASAWLVGVTAGLGWAIKPYSLLAWIAIEATLALRCHDRSAWRRPEAVGGVAAMVVYGAIVLIFVPQYLVVADQVQQVYSGMDSPATFLFQIVDLRFWIVGLALMLILRLPGDAGHSAWMLFAAWTGFLLAAIVQMKGWNYHLYPARVVCLLFFVTLGTAVLQAAPALRQLVRGGLQGLAGGVILTLLAWSARYVVESRVPAEADLAGQLVALSRASAPGEPMAVLSMRAVLYPAFPAVNYSGAQWSLRHHSLWFLPGLYREALRGPNPEITPRTPESMSSLERSFYDEVIGDLCAKPPTLLLIEVTEPRAPLGRRGLDFAAYYGQDSRFARLFTAYERRSLLGPFTVFMRVRPASCGDRREATS